MSESGGWPNTRHWPGGGALAWLEVRGAVLEEGRCEPSLGVGEAPRGALDLAPAARPCLLRTDAIGRLWTEGVD